MLKQHQLAKKRHAKKLKRKNKTYDPNRFIATQMQKAQEKVQITGLTASSTTIVDK